MSTKMKTKVATSPSQCEYRDDVTCEKAATHVVVWSPPLTEAAYLRVFCTKHSGDMFELFGKSGMSGDDYAWEYL